MLSYPLSESPQDMSNDTSPSSHQSALAPASGEGTNPSQQRHVDAEESIINDSWITSAVQTFGLSVEPFGTRNPQVGS